jgi:nucleoid-associated protein YejK
LEDVKTDVVEVKLWEPDEEGAFPAIKETAYIGITSYGGDTAGYKIAFTLHFTGEKVMGKFDPATKTFTAE